MARVWTCGFEMRNLLEVTGTASGTASISTSNNHSGGAAAIGTTGGASARIQVYKDITGVTEFYLRFWMRVGSTNTRDHFELFDSGGTNRILRLNWGAGSVITVLSGNSSSNLGTSSVNFAVADTYMMVEVHFLLHGSSGSIEIKLDGVSAFTYSGNTNPNSVSSCVRFQWQVDSTARSGETYWLDDVAINDTSGGVDDSWCGDGYVVALNPNGNGNSSQFVGSDGNSTDNYLLVDEAVSNDDTDYVQSATVTDKDLYALSNLATLASGWSVKRLWVGVIAKRANAAVSGSLKTGIRSSTTESFDSGTALGTTYQFVSGTEHTVNPHTTAAWSESEVNALEAGIEVS